MIRHTVDDSELCLEENPSLRENYKHCQTIATAISNIARFSLDEAFRKESFAALRVQSTNELERKIRDTLRANITGTKPEVCSGHVQIENEDKDKSYKLAEGERRESVIEHKAGGTVPTIVLSKNWLRSSIRRNHRNARTRMNVSSLTNNSRFWDRRSYTCPSLPESCEKWAGARFGPGQFCEGQSMPEEFHMTGSLSGEPGSEKRTSSHCKNWNLND